MISFTGLYNRRPYDFNAIVISFDRLNELKKLHVDIDTMLFLGLFAYDTYVYAVFFDSTSSKNYAVKVGDICE